MSKIKVPRLRGDGYLYIPKQTITSVRKETDYVETSPAEYKNAVVYFMFFFKRIISVKSKESVGSVMTYSVIYDTLGNYYHTLLSVEEVCQLIDQ